MSNKKELPEDLMDFIENSKWTFAKTYAQTWPHEYIVQEKVDNSLFLKLADYIDKFGHEDYLYKVKQIYFEYEGHTYWRIGNIISRCLNKDAYYQRKKDSRLPIQN